jgi:nucleotide-binding universal stress UspA family protein
MKILVATDDSVFSDAAVEMASSIFSRRKDLSVKIVSAYETPAAIAAEPFSVPADVFQEIADMERARSENCITHAISLFRTRAESADIQLSSCVGLGRPASVIIDVAGEWGADLIIVGSHGSGLWKRAMLGSVSDAVVHHAPCSVLVVRPAAANG